MDVQGRRPAKRVDIDLAVCILFYERPDQTIECIKSFLPSGVSIYVMNNGSSRSSRQVLGSFCENYRQVRILDSDVNLGVGPGRNYLVDHTTQEWALFVDNDILMKTTDWMQRFASCTSIYNDVEVFVPRLFVAHENRFANALMIRIDRDRAYIKVTIDDMTNTFPGGASFVNRKLFNRLGLYDGEMFIGFEDFELSIRGILSGNPVRVRRIPDIVLIHNRRRATKEADRHAALLRYDHELLAASFNRIIEKHGVALPSDWEDWCDAQLQKVIGGAAGYLGEF